MKKNNNNRSWGKFFAAIILVICACVIIFMTIGFVRHRMAYAVTDAVFVRTDSLTSAGFNLVSGRVQTISKNDGDAVKKNEILARLDDTNYRLTVKRLAARLSASEKEMQAKKIFLERLKKETILNQKIAGLYVKELKKQQDALNAQVDEIQVEIKQLKKDNKRYQTLLKTGAVSHSKAEAIFTRLKAKRLEKKAVIKKIDAIGVSMSTARHRVELSKVEKLRIKETKKNIEILDEKIKEINAALQNAENDLNECTLRSPLAGRVARRFISPGSIVSPQKVAFSLINPNDVYIIVLLEEQKLAGVAPGALANITIDAYPDLIYKGRVEKIMPASAATFALAPRDISAGEFTKVAQRIPVRIKITNGDISRLRIGMGGEVEIKRGKKQG